MNNAILDIKYVGEIDGDFIIPSYQRGYRWGKQEVERLLEDIYNACEYNDDGKKKKYCLQPIVVHSKDNMYELIDGQQRLTTLFLIYKYINKILSNEEDIYTTKFTISYESSARKNAKQYLESLDDDKKNENIDFYYIYNAYENIKQWFENKFIGDIRKKRILATNFDKYFEEQVQVIWYEVPQDETDKLEDLFTRLNIGKIRLTSSELVKAALLKQIPDEEQTSIALQWDEIERELHDDAFWSFLTNPEISKYPTRIDLVLNLITHKETKDEEYYTFYELEQRIKNEQNNSRKVWDEIYASFLKLRDWYNDHELFHKIGYLITISENKNYLQIAFDNYNKCESKESFKDQLNLDIKNSITHKHKKDYSEWNYNEDYEYIKKLLILFNVETISRLNDKNQRFPFEKFKIKQNGIKWSLEHIDAQHPTDELSMKKDVKTWLNWIKVHKYLASSNSKLAETIEKCVKDQIIDEEQFRNIRENILDQLENIDGKISHEHLHKISNMALINTADNASLSNALFFAKRQKMLDMDKEGKYIPFCTRMVFVKYYNEDASHLLTWSKTDRKKYLEHINLVLKEYLNQDITITEEED